MLSEDISGKSTHAVFLIIQTAVVALVGVCGERFFYRSSGEALQVSCGLFGLSVFAKPRLAQFTGTAGSLGARMRPSRQTEQAKAACPASPVRVCVIMVQ